MLARYQQLLNEIHQCYLDQRERLLSPSITSTVTELTSQNNRDHCALVSIMRSLQIPFEFKPLVGKHDNFTEILVM